MLVILTLLAIPSCKHGNTGTLEPVPEQVVYTVTFDTDGGSEISAKSVNADEAVAQPDSPTKTGFVFDGWYTDSQLTTAWDFETKVTQNITLYAKWKILVLNVTFFTDGGTEIDSQKVNYNEKAVKPASDPTKENCTFDGWYTDRTYSTEFDFTKVITADTTVYAKWTANSTPTAQTPTATATPTTYNNGVFYDLDYDVGTPSSGYYILIVSDASTGNWVLYAICEVR